LDVNTPQKTNYHTTKGTYTVENNSAKVSFTAYKTTDKSALIGVFKKITLSNTVQGETALETLNSTQFNIPVNSLFTNDGPEVETLRI
jgi:uncharacterized protein (UPF0218 family)